MTALTIAQPTTDIDEMGEASFPASDPPAVWTWEVKKSPPKMGTDAHVGSSAPRVG